jgi:sugar phosphate isomerase/epimerase
MFLLTKEALAGMLAKTFLLSAARSGNSSESTFDHHAKMKIGIDSYCYHRFFGEVYPMQEPSAQRYTMETFLDRAKELGCDGVSLESCFFPEFGAAYLSSLKEKLDTCGFDRVYAWGHPDGLEAGGNAKAKDEMIRHIDHAAAIGAPVMRVVGSSLMFRSQPHEPQLKILAGWFREAADVAERKGIRLAVENHIDYNSDEIKWLIDEVDSEYFGINLDTANFLRVLDDPLEATRKLAKHVYATHVKDLQPVKGVSVNEWYYFSSVAAGSGLIQIGEIAQVLKDAGYQGFLAFETDMPHPLYRNKEEAMIEESIKYLRNVAQNLK